MSPLAKVFVVLNLVLALGFLGVSATLFTTREKYTDTISKLKSNTEKWSAQANQKLDELEGDVSSRRQNEQRLMDRAQGLEQNVDRLTGEKGDLSNQLASKEAEIQNLGNRIEEKDRHIQQKDQEIARLSESNEQLMTDAQSAKEAKTMAETMRARAFLDREQLAKELEDMRIQYVQLERQYGDASDTINMAQAAGLDLSRLVSTAPPPPIDGMVLAVRPDADLVILSVGENDSVKEGFEFTIYRSDRFVAKVRVIRTTDDLAGARILYTEPSQSIAVGDKASTRLAAMGG